MPVVSPRRLPLHINKREELFVRLTIAARYLSTCLTPFVTVVAVFVPAALTPAAVSAQTAAVDPTRTSPWDSTVVVGFLSGRPDRPDARAFADDWFNAAQAGVVLGRYFTPHVRTEIEFGTSTEGRRFVDQVISVPGLPYPVPLGSDEYSRLSEVSASFSYQFLENQWVHPFVQGGAAADFDRTRVHTYPQPYVDRGRLPGNQITLATEHSTDPSTTVTARAILAAGAKLYVTHRMFVRTDARFGTGQRGQHVSFRIGIGWDF